MTARLTQPADYPPITSTLTGVTQADLDRKAEADVETGRLRGYAPVSRTMGEQNGLLTMTIEYQYSGPPQQAPLPTVAPDQRSAALAVNIGAAVIVFVIFVLTIRDSIWPTVIALIIGALVANRVSRRT